MMDTCTTVSELFMLLCRVHVQIRDGRVNSPVDSPQIACSPASAALCLPNDQVDVCAAWTLEVVWAFSYSFHSAITYL